MKSILVVDDEVAVAEVLASLLSDAGYHVIPASNGKHALARLDEATPQLILTDFMMPLLVGKGLIAALKADPRRRDIPVVVMTSIPERTVAEQSDGYAGFLRKPFRIRDVLAIVAKLIGPGG
jgi:two-component system, chemotaxis family, chemotaxis protein CheY